MSAVVSCGDDSEADVVAGSQGQHISPGEHGVDDGQHTFASLADVADCRRRRRRCRLVPALLSAGRRRRRAWLAGIQRRHRVCDITCLLSSVVLGWIRAQESVQALPRRITAETSLHGASEPMSGRGYSFYRATLCISAVFGVARCPSVFLSVCHVRAFYLDG